MSKIKENEDYKINIFNATFIIVLSTFAVLIFLSSALLSGIVKQVWADSVIDNIPVGNQPNEVAYDSGNLEVYVTNLGDNPVSVISTFVLQVVATIPVGTVPIGVAYDSDNGKVYVANANSNNICN